MILCNHYTVTPPFTPNTFWGFNKSNSQKNYPTLSCINWHNKYHLGYTGKFLGNKLCNPRGRNGNTKNRFFFVQEMWPVVTDPRTPKQLKGPKKWLWGGSTPKWPKKGQKWLKRGLKVTQNPFSSHFWPFFGPLGRRPHRVTFEVAFGSLQLFRRSGVFSWHHWSRCKNGVFLYAIHRELSSLRYIVGSQEPSSKQNTKKQLSEASGGSNLLSDCNIDAFICNTTESDPLFPGGCVAMEKF